MMLYRLAGIAWILAAIVAGLLAAFLLIGGQWPGERELGLPLIAGALIAAGNGILGLFRSSPRVALWSVASAVAWVAVSVVVWVAVWVVGAPILANESNLVVFGLLPAVLPVLAALASLLARRGRR